MKKITCDLEYSPCCSPANQISQRQTYFRAESLNMSVRTFFTGFGETFSHLSRENI